MLHVRNAAPPDDAVTALECARSGPPGSWEGVHATEGKSVLELAVIETSKGHALDTLRESLDCDVVIYLGDDVTDEKAFAHLRPDAGDIGIKVGDGGRPPPDSASRTPTTSPRFSTSWPPSGGRPSAPEPAQPILMRVVASS